MGVRWDMMPIEERLEVARAQQHEAGDMPSSGRQEKEIESLASHPAMSVIASPSQL